MSLSPAQPTVPLCKPCTALPNRCRPAAGQSLVALHIPVAFVQDLYEYFYSTIYMYEEKKKEKKVYDELLSSAVRAPSLYVGTTVHSANVRSGARLLTVFSISISIGGACLQGHAHDRGEGGGGRSTVPSRCGEVFYPGAPKTEQALLLVFIILLMI